MLDPTKAFAASRAATSRNAGREMKYGHHRPVYGTLQFIESQAMPVLPDRPARVQVEQKRKLQQAEHLGEYNIWYHRWSGENNYERAPRASTRCVLETDAGLTRADYTNPGAVICLHFARGHCIYGKDCCYRHCAPNANDETQMDAPHDVFGRDRHASFRDDMGGTGTWNKECKTLYVGRICCTPPEPEVVDTLLRHFGEWGVLESVRVLKPKGCAFITYTHRCSAEMAKVAMEEQALDNDEQINVRWAYDDPNPRAQAVKLRNAAQQMLAAMEKKGELDAPAQYPDASSVPDGDGSLEELEMSQLAELHAAEPPAKRQMLGGGAAGSAADGAASVGYRAMTREEHMAAAAAEAKAAAAAAERAAADAAEAERSAEQQAVAASASRLDAILDGLPGDAAEGEAGADPYADFIESVGGGGGGGGADGGAARLEADAVHDLPPGIMQPKLPDGWREYQDPATGHNYYVHEESGASSWSRPSQAGS